jgi:hypothetical protein
MKAYVITNLVIWALAFIGNIGVPGMGAFFIMAIGMIGWSIYILAQKKADQ